MEQVFAATGTGPFVPSPVGVSWSFKQFSLTQWAKLNINYGKAQGQGNFTKTETLDRDPDSQVGRGAGTLPCLLRGHRLWSVAARRPILGLELLRGQGFVGDVRVEGEVHGKHFCVPATRWGVDLDCVLLI